MAKVKNLTPDTLSLFRADAPPVDPGGEVTVRDANFVDRAWPKSTWDLLEKPVLADEFAEYVDQSTDEAWLFAVPEPAPEPVADPAPIVGERGPEVANLPDGTAINTDTTEV